MPNMGDEYKLSEEMNKKYFQEGLLPNLKIKYNFSSRDNPKAYFTAGLPGAGKSKIVEHIKLTKPNIIVIDADELRKEHPHSRKILEKYGALASAITHKDAVRWVKLLKQESFDRRADYVLDSSMRHYKSAAIEIGQAVANGYKVEVTMIAVNKYESLEGMYDRFLKQYKNNFIDARFVDPKLIEDASESIIKSVEVIDNIDIDRFLIVGRDLEVIYDNLKDQKGRAVKKYEYYTDLKNWTEEKRNELKLRLENITKELIAINAPSQIIESIKTDVRELSSEMAKISNKRETTKKSKIARKNSKIIKP